MYKKSGFNICKYNVSVYHQPRIDTKTLCRRLVTRVRDNEYWYCFNKFTKNEKYISYLTLEFI